jgi:hypothetical protein
MPEEVPEGSKRCMAAENWLASMVACIDAMAEFQVTETFVLEARSFFVLAGSIMSGEVAPGMAVCLPLNSGFILTLPIKAVEFVLRAGGVENVCLCIHYADEVELSLWRGLNIGNETLRVLPGDESGFEP